MIKFANFFSSKIAAIGGIDAGDTEFTLSAGDGAKCPDISGGHHFYFVFIDQSANREVVKVTGVASDTCTIVRGQDGTTPRAFAQDDVVELRPVNIALEDLAGRNGAIPCEIDNEAANKKIKARDHNAGIVPEIANVIVGTGDPPTANTVPIGTLFLKYVA
jgi:hypothetical protein